MCKAKSNCNNFSSPQHGKTDVKFRDGFILKATKHVKTALYQAMRPMLSSCSKAKARSESHIVIDNWMQPLQMRLLHIISNWLPLWDSAAFRALLLPRGGEASDSKVLVGSIGPNPGLFIVIAQTISQQRNKSTP